jgi:hypothetical protein
VDRFRFVKALDQTCLLQVMRENIRESEYFGRFTSRIRKQIGGQEYRVGAITYLPRPKCLSRPKTSEMFLKKRNPEESCSV